MNSRLTKHDVRLRGQGHFAGAGRRPQNDRGMSGAVLIAGQPARRGIAPWTWVAAMLSVGLITVGAGGVTGGAPRDEPAKDRLLVVLSTEPQGYLTPCGCSQPMIGGFPRRASLFHSLERQAALVNVENGDLTHALGRQDELKAETLVEMFDQLGYAAINLGENDFRLGVPYLRSLQPRFKGALLSANARTADGKPLFEELVVTERKVAGKPVKVVITGVLSEQFHEAAKLLNPGVRFEAPAEALERLKPQILAGGEIRVVLYHGPMAEAEEIARQFPFFTLIVAGHEGDHPVDVKHVGAVTLMCSGQDGKYIGTFQAGAGKPQEAKYTELGPDLPDDKEILQTKQNYLERVASEDLLAKVPRAPTANDDAFAGSPACAGCHAEADRIWRASGHAHALETLAKVKQDRDPECVLCHVVGLDRKTGFTTPENTPA